MTNHPGSPGTALASALKVPGEQGKLATPLTSNTLLLSFGIPHVKGTVLSASQEVWDPSHRAVPSSLELTHVGGDIRTLG